MTYVTGEARQQLLDAVADAIDEIAASIAALGEAYELLDEHGADRLEAELFRPLQSAYGRAKRTHAEFAARSALPPRTFAPAGRGAATTDVRALVEDAVDAAAEADDALATLQDSMMPVEVGDPELRAGLAEVRELIGGLESRAGAFLSRLGR